MEQRQAVVIIHGIGEQRPMSTLRGFVTSLTSDNESGGPEVKFFSKPDELSDLYELRRLTTPEKGERPKTDFFEYYWAYNMRDTTIGQVLSWVADVIFRWPWSLPKRIAPLHASVWILLIASICIFIFADDIPFLTGEQPVWVGTIGVALSTLIGGVLTAYVGDAARYMSPAAGNIAERQKIRREGIALLRALHESKSRKYSRIIVVGHSLGSIIGYDIIRHLWSEYNTKYNASMPPQVLTKFESAYSKDVEKPEDFPLENYVKHQGEMRSNQNENGNNWLISHFITLGSPLTHASFLLAKNKKELAMRMKERELPSSPPAWEKIEGMRRFTYQPKLAEDRRVLHHGCPFACTKWTNVYFTNDFVGGPLAPDFGPGVKEHRLKMKSFFTGNLPFLSHTHYWAESPKGYKKSEESINIIKEIIGFKSSKTTPKAQPVEAESIK